MKTQQELQQLFREFLIKYEVDVNLVAIGPKGAQVPIENFSTMPDSWIMSLLFTEMPEEDKEKIRSQGNQVQAEIVRERQPVRQG